MRLRHCPAGLSLETPMSRYAPLRRLRLVAATARSAAFAPGRVGAVAQVRRLRAGAALELATARPAALAPGRVWRVPRGSRSASSAGFFFAMISP